MYLKKAALGSQNIVFKFPAEKVFIFCYKRTDWIVCIWSDNSGVISDLQTAVRGRLRVRVFRTEHALLVWRAKIFEVRALRT